MRWGRPILFREPFVRQCRHMSEFSNSSLLLQDVELSNHRIQRQDYFLLIICRNAFPNVWSSLENSYDAASLTEPASRRIVYSILSSVSGKGWWLLASGIGWSWLSCGACDCAMVSSSSVNQIKDKRTGYFCVESYSRAVSRWLRPCRPAPSESYLHSRRM